MFMTQICTGMSAENLDNGQDANHLLCRVRICDHVKFDTYQLLSLFNDAYQSAYASLRSHTKNFRKVGVDAFSIRKSKKNLI
jgi:hypothetical protein